MSTETLDDVETWVDLDAAVPCEWFYGCRLEVEWVGAHRCCPAEYKLCTPHKDRSQEDWASNGGLHSCLRCGVNPMPTPEWRPV